jgi:uncharacterized OB-fold protein
MSDADPNPWRAAVIEACVVGWVDFDENDPVGTLANLIRDEVAMALDPAISSAAVALIDSGKREALAGLKCARCGHSIIV